MICGTRCRRSRPSARCGCGCWRCTGCKSVLVVVVGDVPELPPDDDEEDAGTDERKPERRCDPPAVGDDATDSCSDDHASVRADRVDAANAALELERYGA